MELPTEIFKTETYHYSMDNTVTDEYSGMEYIAAAKAAYPEKEKLINIIDALQNYGHYIQKSGWTDGRTHADISSASDLNADSIAEAIAGTEGMETSIELENSGVSEAKFALALNSKTVISVYLGLDDNTAVQSVTGAKANGTKTINGKKYYRYDTAGIAAGNLGKTYTIKASTDTGSEEAVVTASAMSYVCSVLKKDSGFSQEQKYAMTAYYNYYKAADAYRN